jgi:hypothetical protein
MRKFLAVPLAGESPSSADLDKMIRFFRPDLVRVESVLGFESVVIKLSLASEFFSRELSVNSLGTVMCSPDVLIVAANDLVITDFGNFIDRFIAAHAANDVQETRESPPITEGTYNTWIDVRETPVPPLPPQGPENPVEQPERISSSRNFLVKLRRIWEQSTPDTSARAVECPSVIPLILDLGVGTRNSRVDLSSYKVHVLSGDLRKIEYMGHEVWFSEGAVSDFVLYLPIVASLAARTSGIKYAVIYGTYCDPTVIARGHISCNKKLVLMPNDSHALSKFGVLVSSNDGTVGSASVHRFIGLDSNESECSVYSYDIFGSGRNDILSVEKPVFMNNSELNTIRAVVYLPTIFWMEYSQVPSWVVDTFLDTFNPSDSFEGIVVSDPDAVADRLGSDKFKELSESLSNDLRANTAKYSEILSKIAIVNALSLRGINMSEQLETLNRTPLVKKASAWSYGPGCAAVVVDTEFIKCTDEEGTKYNLGEFRIIISSESSSSLHVTSLNAHTSSVNILNLTNPVRDDVPAFGCLHAPYVLHEEGSPCFGTAREPIFQALSTFQYDVAVMLILQFLQFVNIHDEAGQFVIKWPVAV